MQIGELWAVMIALVLAAVPVAFYASIAASTLPALFPTASRFGAMAIAYNVSVSLFGGTTPLFSQALIDWTGNTLMPAFYIMFFAAMGRVRAPGHARDGPSAPCSVPCPRSRPRPRRRRSSPVRTTIR